MAFNEHMSHAEWVEIYKKLVYWELEIDNTEHRSMAEVFENQKDEANANFSKFVIDNYSSWLNDPSVDRPLMSHQLMKKRVFPKLKPGEPLFFIVIDNLRYDQWKIIEPVLLDYFNIDSEELYYSILPTTTAYSRNSIFSGLLPLEMAKFHPDLWVHEDDDDAKNKHEEQFLARQIQKQRLDIKHSYYKVIHANQGRHVLDSINIS